MYSLPLTTSFIPINRIKILNKNLTILNVVFGENKNMLKERIKKEKKKKRLPIHHNPIENIVFKSDTLSFWDVPVSRQEWYQKFRHPAIEFLQVKF